MGVGRSAAAGSATKPGQVDRDPELCATFIVTTSMQVAIWPRSLHADVRFFHHCICRPDPGAISYLEGYQQRVGLHADYMKANRKAGTHQFQVRAWVGADDTDWQMLSDAPKIIWMKENTPTIVEMMGAKIEITATAKNAFTYRIVEPMPMQPYGLEMRTTTSTRIIYY